MTETTNYNYLSSKIPNKARRSSGGGSGGTNGLVYKNNTTKADTPTTSTDSVELGNYAQRVYNATVTALEHSSDNKLISGVTGNSLTEAGARDYIRMEYEAHKDSKGADRITEAEYKQMLEWLS